MKFLISNDDGVYALGLLALYQALSTIGEVVVVAPNSEQSGFSSALSVTTPLHTHQLPSGFIAVNGSPADCIYLALHELYQDTHFDCVITGINSGTNLGQDVMFSGTFGAALTAQLSGIPAIATSLVGAGSKGEEHVGHYQIAANEIVKLLKETSILDICKNLPYHVLNVNIPNVDKADEIKGRKITSLGHRQVAHPVQHIVDPRGRDAYWLSLRKSQHELSETKTDHQSQNVPSSVVKLTDDQAVAAGYISLSPVRLHHTPVESLDKLSALVL
ncbi:5'/3'-nucleotidase SurE [Psychrobacter sp. AOP29-E1-4]|uniref:5'/3'-nucleotidase SurE n=1 Tax=Psychrobacter sp. AOP29-E1-4 TaxID=3457703 RepID=UPI0040361D5A